MTTRRPSSSSFSSFTNHLVGAQYAPALCWTLRTLTRPTQGSTFRNYLLRRRVKTGSEAGGQWCIWRAVQRWPREGKTGAAAMSSCGRSERPGGPGRGGILCPTDHPTLKVRVEGSVSMLESALRCLCAQYEEQPRRPSRCQLNNPGNVKVTLDPGRGRREGRDGTFEDY